MASTKEHKAKTPKQVIYIYSFNYFVSGVYIYQLIIVQLFGAGS